MMVALRDMLGKMVSAVEKARTAAKSKTDRKAASVAPALAVA